MELRTPKKPAVTIIGGGITGLTLGCMLARQHIPTLIIDRQDLSQQLQQNQNHSITDGRAYAIAYGSSKTLEQAGIWQHVAAHINPILHIRVSDEDSTHHLDYHHQLVGERPMGFMVDAGRLLYESIHTASQIPHLEILAPATIQTIHYHPGHAELILAGGQIIHTSLVVAADGKHSPTRQQAGIECVTHDYQQTALVCTIAHTNHHEHWAQERFLPTGPFAALPLYGGHHSSLVWVEDKNLAPFYQTMPKEECEIHIKERIGQSLGDINLASPIYHFPLILKQAKSYYKHRLILLGDAAHGIHPLAGQGLNLGFRDIEHLTQLIKQTYQYGGDIGNAALGRDYEKSRYLDSWSLIGITHGLNALFASPNPISKSLRRLGMTLLNQQKPLKRFLIGHAMGLY